MKYQYAKHQIREIINAAKCLRDGETAEIKSNGRGGKLDTDLELMDGPFVDLRYIVKTHDYSLVEGSESNLLLAAQRVRGVGYCAVGRRHFYTHRIPPGWHQNILDPNLPTTDFDYNKHEPLLNFSPVDFDDFIRKTAKLWNIDLAFGDRLL
ncbi:MAG: hypothetical protein EPN23_05335 [Verrucomicrobia bacterium]|nr:MAG: hypothetical protein EPN23_05335 [Verrucomicrobiota bacterium]